MRKLLVKLVAVETALVGWLSYWLFLVYANNPSVASQLSSNLQRFPQLSFSTVDIAVLVVIAALAVTMAFKFQRGLRPGIRLERALQMLENLMKRNLVLEAQVAELKIEKSHVQPSIVATPPIVAGNEPQPGSWEKAFRTPLEAGPPVTPKTATAITPEIPFGRETGIPPPRIEPKLSANSPSIIKPPMIIAEKGSGVTTTPAIIPERATDKPAFANSPPPTSSWEDSPSSLGESKRTLTPPPPLKTVPAVSESGRLKTPYIPVPAPKATPPSVIVGPATPSSPSRTTPIVSPPKISRLPARPMASPKSTMPFASQLSSPAETARPDSIKPPPVPLPQFLAPDNQSPSVETTINTDKATPKPSDDGEKTREDGSVKGLQPTRKRPQTGIDSKET